MYSPVFLEEKKSRLLQSVLLERIHGPEIYSYPIWGKMWNFMCKRMCLLWFWRSSLHVCTQTILVFTTTYTYMSDMSNSIETAIAIAFWALLVLLLQRQFAIAKAIFQLLLLILLRELPTIAIDIAKTPPWTIAIANNLCYCSCVMNTIEADAMILIDKTIWVSCNFK